MEKKQHHIIIAFMRKGVTDNQNTAWYQRARLLGENFNTIFWVQGSYPVANDIAKNVIVRRSLSFSRKSFLTRMINRFFYLLGGFFFTLWHTLSSKQVFVYTHHGFEASIAVVLSFFRINWIADILDAPDLYLSGVNRLLKQGYHGRSKLLFLFVKWMQIGLRRADLLITISTSLNLGLAKLLQEEYQIPADKILPVTNGLNDDLLKMGEESASSYISDEIFRIFYVGLISQSRGIDTVLEAANHLNHIDNLEIVLAGPIQEGYEVIVKEIMKKQGLCERVILLGRIPNQQVHEWILSSDVCLFPFPSGTGLDEVIPIKVFEYLALRKPVVASDLPGVRNVIVDGYNGFLVSPSDSKQLADIINKLYENPSLWSKLVDNSHMNLDKYLWTSINAQVYSRINTMLRE
jgi:glycosyltransferase involved in cell wall biosynthesis